MGTQVARPSGLRWYHDVAYRALRKAQVKKIKWAIRALEKHLSSAQHTILMLGFQGHASDKALVLVRQDIRRAQRSLVEYQRQLSIIPVSEFEALASGEAVKDAA